MTDSLCGICMHQDEVLEYSHGGAVFESICLFAHANFMRVTKPEQCRNFKDENAEAD